MLPCLVNGVDWLEWANEWMIANDFVFKTVSCFNICLAQNWPLFCLPHLWSLCPEDRDCQRVIGFAPQSMQKRGLIDDDISVANNSWIRKDFIFRNIFMFNETFNPPPSEFYFLISPNCIFSFYMWLVSWWQFQAFSQMLMIQGMNDNTGKLLGSHAFEKIKGTRNGTSLASVQFQWHISY